MPTLDYLLPCRMVSIDSRTNALSIFHVIEHVDVLPPSVRPEGRAPAVPAEVVSVWRRDPGEDDARYHQRLTITDPRGEEIELAVTGFRMEASRHRVLPDIPPLQLGLEGTHVLSIYLSACESPATWGDPRGQYAIDVAFAEKLIRVRLTPKQKQQLLQDVQGQGGYQSLLRRLQTNIVGDELVLTVTDAQRLVRGAESYGEGGFQTRLRKILPEVKKQLTAILDAELSGTR